MEASRHGNYKEVIKDQLLKQINKQKNPQPGVWLDQIFVLKFNILSLHFLSPKYKQKGHINTIILQADPFQSSLVMSIL